MGNSFERFVILFPIVICLCAALSYEAAGVEADVEADKLWDFANGLFVRGKSFYPQAALKYRDFLKNYPDDERAETATYRLAECYRLQGKLDKAYETYLEHRKKFPDNKLQNKVDFRLGQVLYQMGKPDDALRYLGPLYKKDLEGDLKQMVTFYYGRALLDAKKLDEGRKVLGLLASDKSSKFSIFASYHLATATLKAGDFEKAIDHYTPVAGSNSSLAREALFRLGELNLKLKKLDAGCKFYHDLIGRFPESRYVPYAAYGIIWARFSSKEYDKCIKAYNRYGKRIDEKIKAEVFYIVGNCYYESADYAKAIESYLSVLRDYPESAYVGKSRNKAAWALFLKGDYEQAIAYAENYLKGHPDGEKADKLHFLSGECHLKLKNFGRARSEFEKVVAGHAKSVFYKDSLFKLAWIQFQQKDYASARRNLRLFAEKFPDHDKAPEAYLRAAECNIKLAKAEKAKKKEFSQEAAKDYQAFLEKYPNEKLREEVFFQLALVYVDIGDNDLAITTFQKLALEFPEGKHASDAHYWIGRGFQKVKEYDKAIPAFEAAIKGPAGEFRERAQYQLSAIYHEKGDLDKAAEVLIPLLAKNPDFEIPQETHIWAADHLREKGEHEKAGALYESFLKRHSESSLKESAYFGLAESCFAQGKWPGAIENYREAVKLRGPSYKRSRTYLGIAYARAGQYAEARPILTEMSEALKGSGDSDLQARALFWLGEMLFEEAKGEKDRERRTARLKEASVIFVNVAAVYMKSEVRPRSMLRIAEAAELTGDSQQAAEEYQRVINEYPNTPFAETAKKKLSLNKTD